MQVVKFDNSNGRYGWAGVSVKEYPASETRAKGVCKHVLFDREHELDSELRYFEVAPGGYSALERHEHTHGVLVLRGRGRVVLGDQVRLIAEHDLVYVPSNTLHQFHADIDSHLGFLCLVNTERDRPQRVREEDIAELTNNPTVAATIKY